ncbi:MAG: rhomboid family intramembrane serine protease [Saprospiraceae bacterium]|nr:rhomboid family intramembrane serine protease [Saprospiraceae bacterium]
MFSSIWEDIKRQYSYGNMVTRLIIVNLIVVLIFGVLLRVILTISAGEANPASFTSVVKFFSLSSDIVFNITHPWVFITSMFLHIGFLHFLFNMLFLYFFGRIVSDLLGNQRILPLYLLGGLAGGLAYLLTANFVFGSPGYAFGASAAVMAIVMAAGVTAPDYRLHLILLGPVKLMYIVGVLLLIDIVGVANMDNTGGRIAHLGGAFFGWLFVYQLRQGNDWSGWVNRLLDRLSEFFNNLITGRRKPKVVYRNPEAGAQRRTKRPKGRAASDPESHQAKLDAILDKIKQSGYDSLTTEEKEFLFNASKK